MQLRVLSVLKSVFFLLAFCDQRLKVSWNCISFHHLKYSAICCATVFTYFGNVHLLVIKNKVESYKKMGCDGPDPPENNPHELVPPPRNELIMNGNQGDDSDEEHEYFGYEPLAQGPEQALSDHDSEDDTENAENPPGDVPSIESMENILNREVWSAPRHTDAIQMDNERAQQVMRAMENFALPQASIPEWAQSISEEQWKQTLNEQIERLKNNR